VNRHDFRATLLGLAVAAWSAASSAETTLTPTFEKSQCDPSYSGAIASRLVCGTVHVPRDHAKVDAGSFALAVTVLRSAAQPPQADPVAMISMWPAQSFVLLYTLEQARQAGRMPHAGARDFILVDARGSGKSQPALCPKLGEQSLPLTLDLAQGDVAAARKRREAFLACRDELVGRGIDLRDFGSVITAKDLDWVRQALGIETWNAYGHGLGTAAAMAMAVMYPQTLRSLTLVSPVAPEPSPPRSTVFAAARDAVFAACARNAACARDYPDLARAYREVLKQLDEKPAIFEGQPAPIVHLRDNRMRITGSVLELAVSQLMKSAGNDRLLPYLISAVREAKPDGLQLVVTLAWMAANALAGDPLTTAIECRDRRRLHAPLPDGASILDRLDLYDICPSWSEPGPPPPVSMRSGVRTLILAAPPVSAETTTGQALAARVGQSAQVIEIPGVNWDMRDNSPCVWKVAAEFIADPAKEPNSLCVETRPPISFAPKSEGLSGQIRIGP
jgi:pimeloyl-ACP methyl ester carboxylesterase